MERKIKEDYAKWRYKYCDVIHPIIIQDDYGNRSFALTLTLVRYEKELYGISAKHGFNDEINVKRYYIPVKEEPKDVINLINFINDKSDVSLCNIDLVIINLSESCIKDFNFLDISKIDEHQKDKIDNAWVSWEGFPNSKVRNNCRKIDKSKSNESITKLLSDTKFNEYTQTLDIQAYKSTNINMQNVRFTEENVIGTRVSNTPDFPNDSGFSPSGMSGGPIWINGYRNNVSKNNSYKVDDSPPTLIGIGIEYYKKDRNGYQENDIVGININKIIDEIEKMKKLRNTNDKNL